MSTFDHIAAELFAARGRSEWVQAATGYAAGKLPPKMFSSRSLEVSGGRYNAPQIRAHSESGHSFYPLRSCIGAFRQDIHAVSAGSSPFVSADSPHIERSKSCL
jgi:hypothetical protein